MKPAILRSRGALRRAYARTAATRRRRQLRCARPQLGVGDRVDRCPQLGVVGRAAPSRRRGSGRTARAHAGAIQVGTWTPFVTGRSAPRRADASGQSLRHISRDTSPCRLADAVGRAGRCDRQRRHAERLPRSSGCWRPKPRNALRVMPSAASSRRGTARSARREDVIAGGHRRVRGEHAMVADATTAPRRRARRQPLLAEQLERRGTPSGPRSCGRPSARCRGPAAHGRRRCRAPSPARCACPGRRRTAGR